MSEKTEKLWRFIIRGPLAFRIAIRPFGKKQSESQLDNLVHHGIGLHVEAKEQLVLVVAKKSDVLQDEGIVCLGIDHALAPCGIETDWFMMGNAIAECLDLLKFLEDGLLSETLLTGCKYLQYRLTAKTERNFVLSLAAEKASSKSLYFIIFLPFVCTVQIFCLTLQRNPSESLSQRQTSGLSFSYRQMHPPSTTKSTSRPSSSCKSISMPPWVKSVKGLPE